MPNSNSLANLRNILAELYDDVSSIRRIAGDAGLNLTRIALNSSAINNWHAILVEAKHTNKVDALLRVVFDEYLENTKLRQAFDAYQASFDQSSDSERTFPLPTGGEIHTAGGTYVAGDVSTSGNFIGRDRIVYSINFFGPIDIKAKVAKPTWQEFDWHKAEQTYRDSLIRQYGTLRVIGATADSLLDNVFTDVFVLNQLTAHRRADIEDLHKIDPDSFRQASGTQQRVSGLALIQDGMKGNYPTCFYILGKPGAGKTTFLKYITMQTARHQTLARVPIFISLHEWARSKHEDLFTFIISRFAVCHVPDAGPFVKLLLEEGKAQLLFDGLDEVRHEGKKRDRLTYQLQDFVRQYDMCQHLITCRIAASEYVFQGFQIVEVADFTPDQIANYATKWFGDDMATYTFFMKELQKPEQKGVYELCNTPLLLSLVCLAFANDRAFPPTHAELYEDALDVLLRRWDNSRQIDRDTLHPDEQIYRELSTQRKKELFARIANRTFQKGEYFFRRRDLEEWITEYLATLPNIKALADMDGQIVLKAIEAQHGILVERARDIYSFSHLTFQEYFTAHYLKQNQVSGAVIHLIDNHLGDPRWREVFLLTASLLSEESANDFFSQMQQGIDQLVAEEPTLLQLLSWADEKSRLTNSPADRQHIVRFVYVFLTLSRALAHERALAFDREIVFERAPAFVRARALKLSLARTLDRTLELARTLELIRELTLDLTLECTLDLSLSFALARPLEFPIEHTHTQILSFAATPYIGFDYSLFYTWSYAELFASKAIDRNNQAWQASMSVYPDLVAEMTKLAKAAKLISAANRITAQPIPHSTATLQEWQHYAAVLFEILQQQELDREWVFSNEQSERLNRYFAANELLIQCLKVATVTDRQMLIKGVLEPPSVAEEIKLVTVKKEKKATNLWWKVW